MISYASTHFIISIPIVKSVKDPRNLGTLALFTAVTALLYHALLRRGVAAKSRREVCMGTMWMLIPFMPGTASTVNDILMHFNIW